MRIGSSDDPVEGERVEKGPNVQIGVVDLIGQEFSDGRGSGSSIGFVLISGRYSEGLACVFLVQSDNPSVRESASIVTSHDDDGFTVESTDRGLCHRKTKFLS